MFTTAIPANKNLVKDSAWSWRAVFKLLQFKQKKSSESNKKDV